MSGDIRALLRRHGLHLNRERGQNFLLDPRVAEHLTRRAGVEPGDVVIEVGTGLGVLTRALAQRAARVISVEIDAGLIRALRAEDLLPDNVELIHADILQLDLAELCAPAHRDGAALRLVANLPYSVATPMLRRLLDGPAALRDWSVMLQSELADRLVASCGSKDYGSFSVLHQLTAEIEQQMELAPEAFFPAPKVRSSFVRVWPREDTPLRPGELARIEPIVRAAFAQRRKTIFNCLRAGGFAPGGDRARIDAALAEAEIDPRARAESIEPERLLALARALLAGAEPDGGATRADGSAARSA